MPMNGTQMGDEVVDAIKVLNPHVTGLHETRLRTYWHAICNAIVLHVQNNADVLPLSHLLEDLSAPTGHHVHITTGPGAGSDGATDEDKSLVGTGSIS